MSIADTRSWRGIAAIIHRRGDEHAVTLEVRDVEDQSTEEWLASGDVAPASPVQLPAEGFWPQPGRPEVRPHREFCDDDELTLWLLSMERETQALADTLAAENDTRMELLVSRSRAFGEWWARTRLALVFGRRREQIRELVPALGHLLASGDVSQRTAAFVMGLRSRYLSAADDESREVPKLTSELLAELDAQKAQLWCVAS